MASFGAIKETCRVESCRRTGRQRDVCEGSVSLEFVCLNTYLLTPWSRVLLEKLTDFQLVKKFHAFYGTRRFITDVTSARHLSLS